MCKQANLIVKTVASIGKTTAFTSAPPHWSFIFLVRDPRAVELSRLSTGYIPTPGYEQDILATCTNLRDLLRHYKHMVDAGATLLSPKSSTAALAYGAKVHDYASRSGHIRFVNGTAPELEFNSFEIENIST